MNKQCFRAGCLKRLRRISSLGVYKKDKQVLRALYGVIQEMNAQQIMLYLPLKSEVNLTPLIKQLRREKRTLYVPFMEGKSFRVVKYRYPLEKKSFGIKEPKNSKKYRNRKLDVAIVPIVGVDVTQRRIGFGKGMYDRFFEKERQHIDKIIFVARTLCYSPTVVTDDYDVRADTIIVPEGIRTFLPPK